MAEAFQQEITTRPRASEASGYMEYVFPIGDRGYRICPLERFRTSIKYQDRPAAADIAFCVAAHANGMTEDRIEPALEDDYLSRDPSASKRAATSGDYREGDPGLRRWLIFSRCRTMIMPPSVSLSG